MTAPPRSILVVRLSAIGDVIHALPVLEALRQAFPQARLGWVVEELSAPLLQGHPDLHKLYVIPKKRWRKNFRGHFFSEIRPFFRAMAADGWDVAIDLQGLSKSALVAWASGAPMRIGFGGRDGREISRLLNTHRVLPPTTFRHVVQRNLSLLAPLGVTPGDVGGQLAFTEEEKGAMRDALRGAGWKGGPLLAVNPGAGWSSKRWPPAHYAAAALELCRQRGLEPLILWGPGEEPLRDEITTRLREAGMEPVVAPPTKVRELAVLISLASLFIGGDTGPSHMAALLGVPTIAIFGASDGQRNAPWPPGNVTVVQRRDLPCVPCWKTECPLTGDAHLQCLRGLAPGEAVRAQKDAVAGGTRG